MVVRSQAFLFMHCIFLMLAGGRRFRSNRLPLYTKPQAVAFLGGLTFLTLGSLWETDQTAVTLATAYFLTFAAYWLGATVTPQVGDFMKGLQRARRKGGPAMPPWNDLASN